MLKIQNNQKSKAEENRKREIAIKQRNEEREEKLE